MYTGNELWSHAICRGMKNIAVSDTKTIFTYVNAPQNIYEMLKKAAAVQPGKPAIIDNYNTAYTYSDFKTKVDQFSSYLETVCGVAHQSRVGLMMYNSMEFCVAFLALCKLGAVSVPLPTKYKEQEVISLVNKSDIEFIICDEDYYSWFIPCKNTGVKLICSTDAKDGYGFSHLIAEFLPETVSQGTYSDTAILMFTSGTTSQSKGVVIKNYNIMHAIISYQRILNITASDISIIPIPIYHITGLIALLGLFIHAQGTLYLHKYFDAERILNCVKNHGITFIHASPTVFSMLLKEAKTFPHLPTLRSFACGSSNIPQEKLKQIHEWLPQVDFHTVYGLTETTSPAAIFPTDACVNKHIGSSGLPIPGTCFKILDEHGEELPPGQVGSITVTGSCILDSYYHLQTDSLKNGWLDTGDLGYFTREGFLYVVDRKKDMVNRGGEKIWCFDVENELYKIPGIQEAAVVGIPDSVYGEVPVAAIVQAEGCSYTRESIQKLLAPRLAKYKIPVQIKTLSAIPVTPNSKTDKKAIKQLFQNKEEVK